MKSSDDKERAIAQRHQEQLISPAEADRQQKLKAMIDYALKEFVGKELTPTLIAEAEGQLRKAFMEMAQAGIYKLPPNLTIDRVELGDDMRIKVYFTRRF